MRIPPEDGGGLDDELPALVGHANRAPPDHAVAGEIVLCHQASVRGEMAHDGAAELAAVQLAGTTLGKLLQRPRQIRHDDPLAGRDAAVAPRRSPARPACGEGSDRESRAGKPAAA